MERTANRSSPLEASHILARMPSEVDSRSSALADQEPLPGICAPTLLAPSWTTRTVNVLMSSICLA
jgi:hypothetical protein